MFVLNHNDEAFSKLRCGQKCRNFLKFKKIAHRMLKEVFSAEVNHAKALVYS